MADGGQSERAFITNGILVKAEKDSRYSTHKMWTLERPKSRKASKRPSATLCVKRLWVIIMSHDLWLDEGWKTNFTHVQIKQELSLYILFETTIECQKFASKNALNNVRQIPVTWVSALNSMSRSFDHFKSSGSSSYARRGVRIKPFLVIGSEE